jgi:hypothetical protein
MMKNPADRSGTPDRTGADSANIYETTKGGLVGDKRFELLTSSM